MVRDHEAQGRTHDLVLLGNDAADSGDFQVGIRLAYELGRPVVNGVSTVSVADGEVTARGDRARRARDLPGAAAGRGDRARGRRRAALPDGPGPDEGQEGGDRGARAGRGAGRTRAGSGCCCRRRHRATCRSSGKGADAAPAVVDLFEQLGVLSR